MKDSEWKALAASNPGRVTYPSWRPKEHWEAKRKAAPWVPTAKTTDWRRADPRKAEVFDRITGFKTGPEPADKPSGMTMLPRPREWDDPSYRIN